MRDLIGKLLLRLCARLPLSTIHRLARWSGLWLAKRNNKHRLISQTNIERCFPELTPEQQQQRVTNSLIATSMTLFESGLIWLGNKQRVDKLIQEVHGEQLLQAGLERGKGVILVAPHLGNWEMIGVYCAPRYAMTNMYKPPEQPWLGQIIRQGRERFQQKLAPTDVSGIKILFQALRNNEIIGILPDQDPRQSGGQFAPFFGIQANTITLLSKLAQRSGATVLCAYAERLPDSGGFALHFCSAPKQLSNKNMLESVTAVNQMVEKAVRQIPDQYQWSYKRFLTRPAGEEGRFYPKI